MYDVCEKNGESLVIVLSNMCTFGNPEAKAIANEIVKEVAVKKGAMARASAKTWQSVITITGLGTTGGCKCHDVASDETCLDCLRSKCNIGRSTGMQDNLVFLLDESLTSIQLFALHM
ncbi:hypothetical protein pdam_00025529 [Pocillopora damicornis]|uniref:Uncharacterized protein n=1 Tax=Pocillopora damicornis TaxID=46731 RepID=A0A3M6TGL9_POCDA|nr:hypothetical protein pdam_00025529 [Pocillopora damicornis]